MSLDSTINAFNNAAAQQDSAKDKAKSHYWVNVVLTRENGDGEREVVYNLSAISMPLDNFKDAYILGPKTHKQACLVIYNSMLEKAKQLLPGETTLHSIGSTYFLIRNIRETEAPTTLDLSDIEASLS